MTSEIGAWEQSESSRNLTKFTQLFSRSLYVGCSLMIRFPTIGALLAEAQGIYTTLLNFVVGHSSLAHVNADHGPPFLLYCLPGNIFIAETPIIINSIHRTIAQAIESMYGRTGHQMESVFGHGRFSNKDSRRLAGQISPVVAGRIRKMGFRKLSTEPDMKHAGSILCVYVGVHGCLERGSNLHGVSFVKGRA